MGSSAPLATAAIDRIGCATRARIEVIGGRIERAPPTAEQADALLGLGEIVRHHFHRRTTGAAATGGWWILAEVDLELAAGEIVRPDLVGWRRARVPERPRGYPVGARPDWVCEVRRGPSGHRHTLSKLRIFQRHGVPHFWLVDPERGTLTAHRWTRQGYEVALQASRWQLVRAEPFDAIEIPVGSLFGEDPEPSGTSRAPQSSLE